MIRVGVIGAGIMGRNHIRVYSELPDVEIVGIADINRETAAALVKKYNVDTFTDHRELLKKNLDAVSVVVPTSLHNKIALDVADAGVNMLIEKPIADTMEGAKEIISKCEDNGVKLMIGHIERFNPIIPVIKRSIKDINIVSIDITRVGPFSPRINDVGVVIDLAVHDIDIARHLTNSEFEEVYALTSRNLSKNEDTAIMSFRMENGVLVHITSNWLTPYKVREIRISATDKYIKGNFITQTVTEYSRYKDESYLTKHLPVSFREPLKLELKSFVDCVANGKQPAITGHDGLKALEIALQCIKGRAST